MGWPMSASHHLMTPGHAVRLVFGCHFSGVRPKNQQIHTTNTGEQVLIVSEIISYYTWDGQ